jgi:hypothetical protein
MEDKLESTSEPKITRILLTVTHDNKTYQLIEVGIHCCYQGLEWLMFPNVYIVCNDETILLGNAWKCGIEEYTFDEVSAHITVKGYLMGQAMFYDTYSLDGQLVERELCE